MDTNTNPNTAGDSANPGAPDNNLQPKHRGRKPCVINYPVGSFTVESLHEHNSGISLQTVIMHLAKDRQNQKVIKLVDSLKSGKRGKPRSQYSLVVA